MNEHPERHGDMPDSIANERRLVNQTRRSHSVTTCFDDISVGIAYTHPHYETTGYIKTLYGKFFPRLAFYGPSDERSSTDVVPVPIHKGFLLYRVILDMFGRFPESRGYMVFHDDFLVFPHRLSVLGKDKIWHQRFRSTIDELRASGWFWWNSRWGACPFNKSIAELGHPVSDPQSAFSDFMYVPAEFREPASTVLNVFSRHDTFLELAWPYCVKAVSSAVQRVVLDTVDHVVYDGLGDWRAHYRPAMHGIHPVKFSSRQNRAEAAVLVNAERCEAQERISRRHACLPSGT